MSIQVNCDICGEKNIMYTNEDIKLQIVNHKKIPYNIYVKVDIEQADDTMTHKILTDKVESLSTKEEILEFIEECNKPESIYKYDKEKDLFYFEANNPEPHICDKCKKSISKVVLEHGKYHVIERL